MTKITNISEKAIFVNNVLILPDNSAMFDDASICTPAIESMVRTKYLSLEKISDEKKAEKEEAPVLNNEPEETVAEAEVVDADSTTTPRRGRRAKATEENA